MDLVFVPPTHFRSSCSLVLSCLFTTILRHAHTPITLRDCMTVPVPKGDKDPSVLDNYRRIALAPNLSQVLEWCSVLKFIYGTFLSTSDLQFGFNP